MNTLNLKITNIEKKTPLNIKIDGTEVKGKINNFGSYETTFSTDKSEIEVCVSRILELSGKLWLLYAIITYLVSVFGIFAPPYDRKCIIYNIDFKVKLNENTNVTISILPLKNDGKAGNFTTQGEILELKNEFSVDKKAKLKRNILLTIKLLSWVAIGVVLTLVLPKYITNI